MGEAVTVELGDDGVYMLPDLAAPQPAPPSPRRARRMRRRIVLAAIVVVAAAAAVVLSSTTADRPTSGAVARSTHTVATVTDLSPSGRVKSISGVPGSLPWALVGSAHPHVVQVDQSGLSRVRYRVPGRVALVPSAHLVWMVGGYFPNAVITVLDPATGRVTTLSASLEGDGYTVIGDDLYVYDMYGNGNAGIVYRFGLRGDRIVMGRSVSIPEGQTYGEGSPIVATSDGHLWVQGDLKLLELVPTANGLRRTHSFDWSSGALLAPIPATSTTGPALWGSPGPSDRIHALNVDDLSAGEPADERYVLTLRGTPALAAAAPGGGLYVSVNDVEDEGIQTDLGVYYYSPAALQAGSSTPTAHIYDASPSGLVVDPAGGVDFISGQTHHLIRWNPRAQS